MCVGKLLKPVGRVGRSLCVSYIWICVSIPLPPTPPLANKLAKVVRFFFAGASRICLSVFVRLVRCIIIVCVVLHIVMQAARAPMDSLAKTREREGAC